MDHGVVWCARCDTLFSPPGVTNSGSGRDDAGGSNSSPFSLLTTQRRGTHGSRLARAMRRHKRARERSLGLGSEGLRKRGKSRTILHQAGRLFAAKSRKSGTLRVHRDRDTQSKMLLLGHSEPHMRPERGQALLRQHAPLSVPPARSGQRSCEHSFASSR